MRPSVPPGQMIMQGFVGFRIPIWVRRLVTKEDVERQQSLESIFVGAEGRLVRVIRSADFGKGTITNFNVNDR